MDGITEFTETIRGLNEDIYGHDGLRHYLEIVTFHEMAQTTLLAIILLALIIPRLAYPLRGGLRLARKTCDCFALRRKKTDPKPPKTDGADKENADKTDKENGTAKETDPPNRQTSMPNWTTCACF